MILAKVYYRNDEGDETADVFAMHSITKLEAQHCLYADGVSVELDDITGVYLHNKVIDADGHTYQVKLIKEEDA